MSILIIMTYRYLYILFFLGDIMKKGTGEEEKEKKTKIFEGKKVRTHWDEEKEKWYFSIVDVIEILTESPRPRKYWADLKAKLIREGSEMSDKIGQLKMIAEDGKMRETDIADTEQILRLIQSIPSKKAEPFKLWLARVGNERIDEIHNPELTIDRAMKTYLKKGYSKEWINQRLKTIEIRKELTDEWERVGIEEESEFAILTDEITKAWSDLSIKDYKKLKTLKKENPSEFSESIDIARKGGGVAGNARKEIESLTGETVISNDNYLTQPEKEAKEKRKKKRLMEIENFN